MAAGNLAYGVTQTHQHQAEAQADAQGADFRPCQYGAAAGKEHQEHGAYKFSDVFSIIV